MKYIKLLALSLSLLFTGISCEEEADEVTFKGGDTPVLTISSTDELTLEKPNEDFSSLQFQWTNPGFEFSNGVNTQDISYVLQIDTAGSDFSNPKLAQLTYSNELSVSFKVKDFNTALSGLELKDFVPHNFEFRVKATLGGTNVTVYSNIVSVTITTYLDVVFDVPDKLFITGAATPKSWMSGGDPAEASQELTKINSYTFQLNSLQVNGGQEFLFVPVYGNWDNKYGFTGDGAANNASGDFFEPGGNNFIAPAASKAYKITVNFKTGKYSFE